MEKLVFMLAALFFVGISGVETTHASSDISDLDFWTEYCDQSYGIPHSFYELSINYQGDSYSYTEKTADETEIVSAKVKQQLYVDLKHLPLEKGRSYMIYIKKLTHDNCTQVFEARTLGGAFVDFKSTLNGFIDDSFWIFNNPASDFDFGFKIDVGNYTSGTSKIGLYLITCE